MQGGLFTHTWGHQVDKREQHKTAPHNLRQLKKFSFHTFSFSTHRSYTRATRHTVVEGSRLILTTRVLERASKSRHTGDFTFCLYLKSSHRRQDRTRALGLSNTMLHQFSLYLSGFTGRRPSAPACPLDASTTHAAHNSFSNGSAITSNVWLFRSTCTDNFSVKGQPRTVYSLPCSMKSLSCQN